MRYIIRHQFRDMLMGGNEFYVTSLFKNILRELKVLYPQDTFDIEVDPNYEKYGQGSIFSCMSFSIINPNNNQYILISLFDNWKYHFMKHLGWQPKNMKQFFYAGGFNYLDYFNFKKTSLGNNDVEFPEDISKVYNTFFYNTYFDCCYDKISEIYNNGREKEKIKKLFFRGWMWDSRKLMTNQINREDVLIIDKNVNNQNLTYIDYLTEMSNYSVSLSLPGGTEVCNRDIECFAIGVPVLRPHLQINYPDPLIPNYNYINSYHSCDYTDGGNAKYLSYSDFQNNLLYTWDMVKDNKEYLDFISENARNWFLRNSTMEKNVDFFLKNINLQLINE